MKVLFISSRFPLPADTGGKIRILNLLRLLAARHEIVMLSFARSGPVCGAHLREMARICTVHDPVEIQPGSRRGSWWFSDPRWHSDSMRLQIESEIRTGGYQFVIAAEVLAGFYAADIQALPRLVDNCELTVLKDAWTNTKQRLPVRAWWEWRKKSGFTASLVNRLDASTVVSEKERELLISLGVPPAKILVAANGVDLQHHRPEWGPPDEATIVYPGCIDFHANRDAMRYFVGEILPAIRARHPGIRLRITGEATQAQRREANPANDRSVEFTGFVPDVRPIVACSAVCVVPLRVGGGTRVKILEAMALGTPVVSTSKGAEGLPLVAGREALVTDTPASFADAVCRLLEESDLRSSIRENALRLVQRQFDWSLSLRPILAYMEGCSSASGTDTR